MDGWMDVACEAGQSYSNRLGALAWVEELISDQGLGFRVIYWFRF